MSLQDDDQFVVNRNATDYSVGAAGIMGVQDTDLFLVNRGGTDYKVEGSELKEYVGGSISPGPGDFTFDPPGSVTGNGSAGNPFVIPTFSVRGFGQRSQSDVKVIISNQKSNKVVDWNSYEDRWEQPLGLTDSDGKWEGYIQYFDTPQSTVEQEYSGDLELGDVYFKVSAQQNDDSVAPKIKTIHLYEDSPGGDRFTSKKFDVDFVMDELGFPGPDFSMRAFVDATVQDSLEYDVIADVEYGDFITSAGNVTGARLRLDSDSNLADSTVGDALRMNGTYNIRTSPIVSITNRYAGTNIDRPPGISGSWDQVLDGVACDVSADCGLDTNVETTWDFTTAVTVSSSDTFEIYNSGGSSYTNIVGFSYENAPDSFTMLDGGDGAGQIHSRGWGWDPLPINGNLKRLRVGASPGFSITAYRLNGVVINNAENTLEFADETDLKYIPVGLSYEEQGAISTQARYIVRDGDNGEKYSVPSNPENSFDGDPDTYATTTQPYSDNCIEIVFNPPLYGSKIEFKAKTSSYRFYLNGRSEIQCVGHPSSLSNGVTSPGNDVFDITNMNGFDGRLRSITTVLSPGENAEAGFSAFIVDDVPLQLTWSTSEDSSIATVEVTDVDVVGKKISVVGGAWEDNNGEGIGGDKISVVFSNEIYPQGASSFANNRGPDKAFNGKTYISSFDDACVPADGITSTFEPSVKLPIDSTLRLWLGKNASSQEWDVVSVNNIDITSWLMSNYRNTPANGEWIDLTGQLDSGLNLGRILSKLSWKSTLLAGGPNSRMYAIEIDGDIMINNVEFETGAGRQNRFEATVSGRGKYFHHDGTDLYVSDLTSAFVSKDNKDSLEFTVDNPDHIKDYTGLWVRFDARGNVSDLSTFETDFELMAGGSGTYQLSFPAVLPGGDVPDTILPLGVGMYVEGRSSNFKGTDTAKSNHITPGFAISSNIDEVSDDSLQITCDNNSGLSYFPAGSYVLADKIVILTTDTITTPGGAGSGPSIATVNGWGNAVNAITGDSNRTGSLNNTTGSITFSPPLKNVTKIVAQTRVYRVGNNDNTWIKLNGNYMLRGSNISQNSSDSNKITVYDGTAIDVSSYEQSFNSNSDDFRSLIINDVPIDSSDAASTGTNSASGTVSSHNNSSGSGAGITFNSDQDLKHFRPGMQLTADADTYNNVTGLDIVLDTPNQNFYVSALRFDGRILKSGSGPADDPVYFYAGTCSSNATGSKTNWHDGDPTEGTPEYSGGGKDSHWRPSPAVIELRWTNPINLDKFEICCAIGAGGSGSRATVSVSGGAQIMVTDPLSDSGLLWRGADLDTGIVVVSVDPSTNTMVTSEDSAFSIGDTISTAPLRGNGEVGSITGNTVNLTSTNEQWVASDNSSGVSIKIISPDGNSTFDETQQASFDAVETSLQDYTS